MSETGSDPESPEGDYPRAVQLAKRTTRAGPGEPAVYRWLVAALGQLGNIEEAGAMIREVTSLLAPVPHSWPGQGLPPGSCPGSRR